MSLLLIDGENISLQNIVIEMKQKHRWTLKYLFGTKNTFSKINFQFCIKYGIKTMLTEGGKNMVDGFMIAKSIDLCNSNPNINEVGIVSGDKIFVNIPRILVPRGIKCTLVVPQGNFTVAKALRNVLVENLKGK